MVAPYGALLTERQRAPLEQETREFSQALGETRVEGVPPGVAQEVYGYHSERQEEAREHDDPPRDLDEAPALCHHVPPAWDIRRRARSDERQDGLGDHRRGADVGGLHEDGRECVRQDVAGKNACRSGAACNRRLDEGLLAQGEDDAADEPRYTGYFRDR